jgi:hypothetical protein
LTTLVGKEAVELALHAATAKAAQCGHQHRQGQLAGASEGGGEIGVTGRGCKRRAVKVFGQSSQNELDGITVLRQKSCQSQENNQLNQQFSYSTGLSSVDWGTGLQSRLNKNCRNSSMPPSSDSLNKPAPKSLKVAAQRRSSGSSRHHP